MNTAIDVSGIHDERVHERMKRDGTFETLPPSRYGAYQLLERIGDEPAEMYSVRNCSCTSTIYKLLDTDESPTWLETMRKAGLL